MLFAEQLDPLFQWKSYIGRPEEMKTSTRLEIGSFCPIQ